MQRRLTHPLPLATILLVFGAVLQACSSNNGSAAPAFASVAATPAPQVARAPGVVYSGFTGTLRPALDVVAAGGVFSTALNSFIMTATMNGPAAAGGPNFYVWGFDKGGGLAAAPFPGQPNVKFNAAVVTTVNADGSASSAVGAVTLDPSLTFVSGPTIRVTIPLALLPSTGSPPQNYLWNVWPRNGVGGTVGQISEFAPDNAMATLMVL